MSHPRKSNLDIGGLQAALSEATEKGAAQPRKPALPTFSRPTAANVAAASAEVPGASATEPRMLNPEDGTELTTHLSTPKVVERQANAEFDINLDLIDPLPTNSRFDYTETEIDKMLTDLIREGKQLKPIELTPHDTVEGRFYALDGYTRTLALRRWGKPTVRAILVDVRDAWERYKASWYANNGSRHTTDYDNGMRWRKMIDDGIIKQPQISISLGDSFSDANVSRIMSIAKLPEPVRELIKEHKAKLSSNFYYAAYQFFHQLTGDDREEKVKALLMSVIDEDLSYRDFTALVAKQVAAAEGKAPPTVDAKKAPQTKPLLLSGREVGVIKEWTIGDKLQISLKKVPVELRDQIKEAVRKILEGGSRTTTDTTPS